MSRRFQVIETQHIAGGILKIILDTRTGVHYLASSGLGISGMTPLLDQDGKVVIKKINK